jgi:hypothetical protein
LLEVKEVKSSLPDMLFNIQDGWVNVAWSNIEAASIPYYGELLTLVMQSKAPITPDQELFSWSSQSEFANSDGLAIEPVNLVMSHLDNTGSYGIVEGDASACTFTLYPNPIVKTAEILLNLPEAAKVKISLVNQIGQEITVLADQNMGIGANTLVLNAESLGLQQGVYFVKMVATGKADSYARTIKVVYTK